MLFFDSIKKYSALVTQTLFGKIVWQKPQWLERVLAFFIHVFITLPSKVSAQARWVLCGAILLILGAWGIQKYRERGIEYTSFAVSIPSQSIATQDKLIPQPVTIHFSHPAKPLTLASAETLSGITLTPPMEGDWKWFSDKILQFTPKEDWPAGTAFTMQFDKGAIAKEVILKEKVTFSTHPLGISMGESGFQQDIKNKKEFYITAAFKFNYSVKPESVREHLVVEGYPHGPVDIKFDTWNREAYISAAVAALPDEKEWMAVTLKEGVEPNAGERSKIEKEKKIEIADVYSFLQVKQVTTGVVVNPDTYEAEQLLSVELSTEMVPEEVIPHVKVVALPEQADGSKYHSVAGVTKEAMEAAVPVKLVPVPVAQKESTLHTFKYDALPQQQILVTVDKGLATAYGFKLARDAQYLHSVPSYEKMVKIRGEGGVLQRLGQKKLSVATRDIEELKVSIWQVLPNRLHYLVTQTYTGEKYQAPFFYSNFSPNDLAKLSEDVISIPAVSFKKPEFITLDVGKYLTPEKIGIFVVRIEDKNDANIKDERLVVVTDLGLVVKANANNTRTVFVQSLSAGAGANGVEVSILGRSGEPVATSYTNAEGKVELPDVTELQNDKQPVMIVARRGDDIAYLPFAPRDRELNYSRFDAGGEVPDAAAQNLKAFVFSDRGLYRPGEKVNLGIIMHHTAWQTIPPQLPVQCKLFNAQGKEVLTRQPNFEKGNLVPLQYALPEGAATGQYTLQVNLIRDSKSELTVGYAHFMVGFYEPDRLKIELQLAEGMPKGWVHPDQVKARVTLANLFGAPAVDHTVKGTMQLSTTSLTFKEYPGYTFHAPQKNDAIERGFEEELEATQTNERGEAILDLNLNRFDKATYRLLLISEGFEQQVGQGITTSQQVLVSTEPHLMGVKPDTSMDYLKVKQKAGVHIVAVNQNLQLTKADNVEVEFIQKSFISSLMKDSYGRYKYQSVPQEKVIETKHIVLTTEPFLLALRTSAPGQFELKVKDGDGHVVSTTPYYVAGEGNIGANLEQSAELSIVLDKPSYKTGDAIKVSIQAPYTGAGLITIEKDRVYTAQWFKAASTQTEQTIYLPPGLEGNAYVNVTFLRDSQDPGIFISPLSYGVAAFSINRDVHTLNMDLKVPGHVTPGQKISIGYATPEPAKIILFGVDEGILQVAGYKTPAPLDALLAKQALGVKTTQLLDLLLPEFSLLQKSNPGGGEQMAMMLNKHLNPFSRKGEASVAFWSGVMDAGPQWQQYEVHIPDYFSGQLRIMAIAVSKDRIGATEKNILSKGDFVIEPNAPLYVTPGDTFIATATIFNNTDQEQHIDVKLNSVQDKQAFGIAAGGNIITIAPQRSAVASFSLQAGAILGNQNLKWSIKSKAGKEATRHMAVAIRPAQPFRTIIQSGQLKEKENVLTLKEKMYPDFRENTFALSSMPTAFIPGLRRYIEHFPYGCTEQVVSKAIPTVLLSNEPDFSHNNALEGVPQRSPVDKAVQILQGRQMNDGSFSYWDIAVGENDEGGDEDESASYAMLQAYIAHFLILMRNEGYSYPPQLIDGVLNYLNNHITVEVATLEEAVAQAYALYVLSLDGRLVGSSIEALQQSLDQMFKTGWRKNSLAVPLLASAYQLQQQTDKAYALLKSFDFNPNGMDKSNSQEVGVLTSGIGNALTMILIAQHFSEDWGKKMDNLLPALRKALDSHSYTTLSSSYMIWALHSYAGSKTKMLPDIQVKADNQPVSLQKGKLWQGNVLPTDFKALHVTHTGQYPLYYQLSEAGYSYQVPADAVEKGLGISRILIDKHGKKAVKAAIGDILTIQINVRNLSNHPLTNVAIVDLLPAGFEVMAHSAKDVTAEGIDFVDVRDDRVIYFGMLDKDETKLLTYQVQVVGKGTFMVPPSYASPMYEPTLEGLSAPSMFTVE